MGEPIATVGDLAGICGHDGTNWEKILIDASKRLVVAVASAIASDVQLHGYYDGSWQKNPLVWGFSGTVGEFVQDTNLDAGTNSIYGTEVPGGEAWVVSVTLGRMVSTTISDLFLGAEIAGADVWVRALYAPTSTYWYIGADILYLGPGDRMEARVHDATGGDVLQLRYGGYKMKLDL